MGRMGTVRIVVTGTILWFILYLLIAYGTGTGSAIPGALGPLYFVWAVFVGLAVGAPFGFLYLIGRKAKPGEIFPTTDAEINDWARILGVFMWGVAGFTSYTMCAMVGDVLQGFNIPEGFVDKHFSGNSQLGYLFMSATLMAGDSRVWSSSSPPPTGSSSPPLASASS